MMMMMMMIMMMMVMMIMIVHLSFVLRNTGQKKTKHTKSSNQEC